MKKGEKVIIHRFRGKVQLSAGDGKELYLSPEQARELANALRACEHDILLRTYPTSKFDGVVIGGDGEA